MTLEPDLRAALEDREITLAALMKTVASAERVLANASEIVIGISSNATVDLLGTYIRREAVLAGLRARIVMGNYDDPIGDTERFRAEGVERMILLPVFDNVIPALEAQIPHMTAAAIADQEEGFRAKLNLTLEKANVFKSVQLGLFHRMGPSAAPDGRDAVAAVIDRFNQIVGSVAAAYPNVQLVDVEAAVTTVGRETALDWRFFLKAKAPYSARVLALLAARLAAGTRNFGSRYLKVLALDCDNTLWGGVLGEDLVEGVKLDPYDYPGNVYWRIQNSILALQRQGVLLCLCTKNNPDDVAEMFARHPHMVLKDTDLVSQRVNWIDKVANLTDLAAELNVDLDSFVFLDDSPVEVEAVRSRLPQITMIQVPTTLSDYPRIIAEVERLFLGAGAATDGGAKLEHYRARAAAVEARSAFGSHEDYLASLELEASIHVDHLSEAARIAELSQKSNQFNLTTRRYTQAQVEQWMNEADKQVFSITVRNRFGDSGLTGVLVLHYDGDVARVDNYLMSCRVLGQGVEFSLWSAVLARVAVKGAMRIEADFIPTAKNAQVRDFYDRLGLELLNDTGGVRRYGRHIADFTPTISNWVKVTDA
ncbi:HAD-IIIC family phosphatase [Sphingomonas sp. KR1UV-12]|uniref:HAD-IIIC family phosphatase n=1 Tax=Sphingomonas aurea TaxID=3063994 RepID=A0ABT9EPB1_9SPHN|nr:HAD-IIIC family phosphatase [Sphingomonas sp. KR1UV-12]MDP1028804.1 HAD-IIIC family phosphatase [Sphingomonas sp. KR1UV-12]